MRDEDNPTRAEYRFADNGNVVPCPRSRRNRAGRGNGPRSAISGTPFSHETSSCTPPVLRSDEVHVWFVRIDLDSARVWRLASQVSDAEIERAHKLRFARDQRRFIACRGQLRIVLGRYLDADPAGLRFTYGPRGKPELCERPLGGGLRFNLSHSGGHALMAITKEREVGVDIERWSTGRRLGGRAGGFLRPCERAAIESLPAALRRDALVAAWTRREAYLKATGEGLSGLGRNGPCLGSVNVATDVDVLGSGEPTGQWRIWSLRSIHHAGAVVARGWDWRPRCFRLSAFMDEIVGREHAEYGVEIVASRRDDDLFDDVTRSGSLDVDTPAGKPGRGPVRHPSGRQRTEGDNVCS